ncbi:general substrate transporter [Zopfochytrium polystomum]|nr:general substrate transporter [Zopfochytrium polystomum]
MGCVVGAAAVSLLADLIGRKFSIILGGIIYTAGGCLQAAAVNLPVFVFARALSGVSVGIMSMCVPLYIAETSPTAIRGRLTTVYQLMITFGILIASCLNGIIISLTKDEDPLEPYGRPWRIAFALQVVPGLTLLVLMLPMPRSPRWLAEKGFHAQGQSVIARLRGFEDEDDDEVVVEYRSIVAGVEYERRIGKAGWAQLFQPGVRRRLALGVVNQFFQQWTGINVILYYGYDLFKKLDLGDVNSSVVFIIINAFINFAFTLPGMWGVERLGRRPLFIYGGMAMCISYLVIFTFGLMAREFGYRNAAWVAVLGIYAFTISFACTWGPVVWTYQSEIFPLRIRAKGTGLSTMSNWLWNAVIALIQPSIETHLSTAFYLIFAGTCFVMTVYAWKFIPETRGKTLEEMDEVFKDSEAVLPSEHVEWSATVAALFSLRGFRSPPPNSRHVEGQEGGASLTRMKDSLGSLSTLAPASLGPSSAAPYFGRCRQDLLQLGFVGGQTALGFSTACRG